MASIEEETRKVFERFNSRIKIMPNGCWFWTGRINNYGYAIFDIGKTSFLAHRWIYMRSIGPIQEGYQLDHLCRNRHCVNPLHLESVTSKENTLRGNAPSIVLARSNKCKNGHDLSNPDIGKRIKISGFRYCEICKNTYNRQYQFRKREVTRQKATSFVG